MGAPGSPLDSGHPGARDQTGGPPLSPERTEPSLPDTAHLVAAWNGPDAVYLVGADWVIEAWNPRCEALWGITAEEAIGRHLDDLIDWEPVSGPGRDVHLVPVDVFEWSERTLDRPRFGPRQGELLIVDDSVSVERAADGAITRFVVTSRDVTRSVTLAQEMAPLSALATSGGLVRDRRAIARQALEILQKGTGADDGIAALIDENGYDFLAELNPGRFGPLVAAIDPRTSPLLAALRSPSRVISGDPESLPLREEIRVLTASLGLRWIVVVALSTRDSIGGILALGWIRSLPEEPPDTLVVQAAAQLSAALENARLLEVLDARFHAAQAVSARLEALVGMSRLPEAGDVETLARAVLGRLLANLAASAGAVWRLAGDRWVQVAEIGLHPAVTRFHKDTSAFGLAMWGGTGEAYSPYIRPFEPGSAAEASIRAASAAGYTARAAFPFEEDGRIAMVVVLYFSGPPGEIAIDDRTLEAIGRSVTAAFANQHLREQLVETIETQRGLAEQYGVMFRDSPNALLRMGADTRIVDINAAAVALLGGTPDDWIGRSAEDVAVIDEGERGRLIRPAEGQRVTYRVQGRRSDGKTFPMEAMVSSLSIGGSESFLVFIRDLADEQRIQGELGLAQKMEAVSQLVAGVAHELNNPLAAIIGFSQILQQDERLPDDLRHAAGLLVQESARTKRIVENLLDFARQRLPESNPTRLRLLVDSVLELQAYQFAGDWLRAEVDVPDDIPAVPLDRSLMQQAILNLTQNAIHAIRAKGSPGTIWIAARVGTTTNGRPVVRLSIADDGPGVPEIDRSRLFLPFFTTREPGQGTGLGLSVSFGIVAAHEGHLSFAPRPGGGSVFTIELPVDGPGTAAGAPPAPPLKPRRATTRPRRAAAPGGVAAEARDPAARSKATVVPKQRARPGDAQPSDPRILVVDDEPAIRAYLDRVLRSRGFDPTLAATGQEALDLVAADRFDLILCDHRMPGMTGTDVYEAIAAGSPKLAPHFVLMSGDVLNPLLQEFARAHRLPVLEKPFDIEMVTTLVRATLAERA